MKGKEEGEEEGKNGGRWGLHVARIMNRCDVVVV